MFPTIAFPFLRVAVMCAYIRLLQQIVVRPLLPTPNPCHRITHIANFNSPQRFQKRLLFLALFESVKITADREHRISQALADARRDMSFTAVGAKWNTPRPTLTNRVAGALSIAEAKEPFQRLSSYQEEFLFE